MLGAGESCGDRSRQDCRLAGRTARTTGLGFHIGVAALLVGIVFLAYANSVQTGFALDNKLLILQDPRVREVSPANVELILKENYWWPKAQSGLYRPLTTLSYLLNYAVLGNADRPAGYHWINLGLHILNAILTWLLALAVWKEPWPAFFTAAIFAVHPVNTECVTNIVGRADLLAGASVLGGSLLYARSTTRAGWRRLPWLFGLFLVALLGVFSKENAVALLGVMLLCDLTFRTCWRSLVAGYAAVAPAIGAMWCARHLVFARLRPPELPFVDNPLMGADFLAGRLTAMQVAGRYLGLLVWPHRLSCDYSYNQIPVAAWPWGWAALALLLVLLSLVLAQYHARRTVFFFGVFFFVTLLPQANLLVIIGSIMAERFLYLPSIGFAGCLVFVVYAVSRRFLGNAGVTAAGVLSLTVLSLGMRTFARNPDWTDDERLWTKAVEVCPGSFKTHKSLAFAWYEQGLSPDNIERVLAEAERAAAIIHDLPPQKQVSIVFAHLGAYYQYKGDLLAQRTESGLVATPRSLPWYRKSVQTLAHGMVVDRAYNDENRRKEIERGRRLDEIADIGNPDVYLYLGLSYGRLGDVPNMLEALRYARRLNPNDPDVYVKIAEVYLATGQRREAAIVLLEALTFGKRPKELGRLIALYRAMDPGGCATVERPNGFEVNMDCPLVKQHVCMAYRDLEAVFRQARRPADAGKVRSIGERTYGCHGELGF